MKITVTAKFKRAVFTWDEELETCTVDAIGFEEGELDLLVEAKVHEGADLEGYLVEVE